MLGGTEVERPLDDAVIQIGPEPLIAKCCNRVIRIEPIANDLNSLVSDVIQILD